MISYQIYNFDKNLGSISVLFKFNDNFIASYNVDLPLTENGLFISGQELNNYLLGMFPQHIIDRKNKLELGISNSAEIESLVIPLEKAASDTTSAISDEQTSNALMWGQIEQEKNIAKALVKFGLLTEDPTIIPNTTL
jgi:hypothetical protein